MNQPTPCRWQPRASSPLAAPRSSRSDGPSPRRQRRWSFRNLGMVPRSDPAMNTPEVRARGASRNLHRRAEATMRQQGANPCRPRRSRRQERGADALRAEALDTASRPRQLTELLMRRTPGPLTDQQPQPAMKVADRLDFGSPTQGSRHAHRTRAITLLR